MCLTSSVRLAVPGYLGDYLVGRGRPAEIALAVRSGRSSPGASSDRRESRTTPRDQLRSATLIVSARRTAGDLAALWRREYNVSRTARDGRRRLASRRRAVQSRVGIPTLPPSPWSRRRTAGPTITSEGPAESRSPTPRPDRGSLQCPVAGPGFDRGRFDGQRLGPKACREQLVVSTPEPYPRISGSMVLQNSYEFELTTLGASLSRLINHMSLYEVTSKNPRGRMSHIERTRMSTGGSRKGVRSTRQIAAGCPSPQSVRQRRFASNPVRYRSPSIDSGSNR